MYQSAYLTEELNEIVDRVQSRMSSLGVGGTTSFIANEAVRQKVTDLEKTGDDGEVTVKRRDVIGAECPICFDDLGGDENIAQLTFCQAACGTNFHKECIKMWTSQHTNNPTCPACRQPWTDVTTGGNSEGYVNLASLQGQSRVRDTSTYNSYNRRRYYY